MRLPTSSPSAPLPRVPGPPRPGFSFPIAFTVPITPVGKARARAGNGHFYTPAATVAAEKAIGQFARAAMRSREPLEGPVVLTVRAILPIPRSWPKWRQEAARHKRIFPATKPDASNILKLVEDGMNGIVWIDDAQVVSAAIHKDYGSPRLEIEVAPVEEDLRGR